MDHFVFILLTMWVMFELYVTVYSLKGAVTVEEDNVNMDTALLLYFLLTVVILLVGLANLTYWYLTVAAILMFALSEFMSRLDDKMPHKRKLLNLIDSVVSLGIMAFAFLPLFS